MSYVKVYKIKILLNARKFYPDKCLQIKVKQIVFLNCFVFSCF